MLFMSAKTCGWRFDKELDIYITLMQFTSNNKNNNYLQIEKVVEKQSKNRKQVSVNVNSWLVWEIRCDYFKNIPLFIHINKILDIQVMLVVNYLYQTIAHLKQN